MPDGRTKAREKGAPQGGVVSPVLSNLFLYYVFDKWMGTKHKENPGCRYADDGLVHCKSHSEVQSLRSSLDQRFKECGLELHPEKTKIVYCRDSKRREEYTIQEFDFLGYTFRSRPALNQYTKQIFNSFEPAVSKTALKATRKQVKIK